MEKLGTKGAKFKTLFANVDRSKAFVVAVIGADSKEALEGAFKIADDNIATPIIFGEKATMEKIANELNHDLSKYRVVNTTNDEAMLLAIKMVHQGEVHALMKGSIHSDNFMAAIVHSENGLRTNKRMTHCMVVDVPVYHKLLLLTDCALNIAPDLATKKAIVQNAIDLMHALGVAQPKVAMLSDVEIPNAKMPTTLEYVELCKMAEQGQITGGLLDGPLEFDLAISKEAVACKKIISKVAGDADILLMPEIQAGNILFKALDYFANALVAGIVLGAKVPVILTSRAAGATERATSCMLARFYNNFMHQ